MAQRSMFQNPLPQSVDGFNNAQTIVDAYNNSLNQDAGFAAKHPIVTGVLGGILGGPAGALVAPLAAQKKERARRMQLIESYNNFVKNAVENQKNLDAINQPRNEARWMQSNVDAARIRSDVAQQAPDLYGRNLPGLNEDGSAAPSVPDVIPSYSADFLKNYNQGVFADNDAEWGQGVLQNQAGQAYGIPNQTLGGQPGQTPNATGAFQAEATETGAPPAPPRNRPAFISNPEAILNQLGAVTTGGLSQGQERYKFDQEMPKLKAEIDKALAEGRAADALALLRQAMTTTEKGKPAVQQSQVSANQALARLRDRTPGSSGGGRSSDWEQALAAYNAGNRSPAIMAKLGLGPNNAAAPTAAILQELEGLRGAANDKGFFGIGGASEADRSRARQTYNTVSQRYGLPGLPNDAPVSRPQRPALPIRNGAITAPSGRSIIVK